jgi:DDE superfamily endonuclease
VILFVGRTVGGRQHDYSLLKSELPPALEWFTLLTVLVDLGYLGIQSDYAGEELLVPHKKPRKSQHNPTPTLTDTQRADNHALGSLRVTIEHAIAGLKRYNILVHRFRNRRATFQDDVIAISAALWNFSLIY